MPPVVRREGDPQGAWDQHAYLWRPDAGRLVEMIQLEHRPMFGAEWTVGWDGGGPGIAVWDTTKAWDAAGQPRGVVAAHIPQMPHFIRCDELARGQVRHAAFLALPNYAPGRAGYARSSDGTDAAHPCRAGERLRLRPRSARPVPRRHPERTVAEGLATYGAVVGDRTMHGVASTSGPGVIAATQDPAGSSSDGVASTSASPTSRSSPNPDQEVTTMNEQTAHGSTASSSPPSPS